MAKRKAESVDEVGNGPTTRRSSRHKPSNDETSLPNKPAAKLDHKVPKPKKAVEKAGGGKPLKKSAKIEVTLFYFPLFNYIRLVTVCVPNLYM